jgi:DNA repair protein RadC
VKEALARNAAAMICSHGHPSGDSTPSQADELITVRLKEALALVDIRLLDHILGGFLCVTPRIEIAINRWLYGLYGY